MASRLERRACSSADGRQFFEQGRHRRLDHEVAPRALLAVDAFSDLFESKPVGQGDILFRNLTEQIDDFGAKFLESMALERS